jgi:hypothetical protein
VKSKTSGCSTPGLGSLTEFQAEWRGRIEAKLRDAGIQWSSRQVTGDGQTFVVVEVPTSTHQVVSISIFADEVSLVLAEEWSFHEAEASALRGERLEAFVEVLRTRTTPHQA